MSNRIIVVLLFLLYFGPGSVNVAIYPILSLTVDQGGIGLDPIEVTFISTGSAAAAAGSIVLIRWLEKWEIPRGTLLSGVILLGAMLTAMLAARIDCLFDGVAQGTGLDSLALGVRIRAVLEIGILVACWTLCNTVATAMAIAAILAHLNERVDLFCVLRASGTLGFLCACVVSGSVVRPLSADPFRVATLDYLILSLFCLLGLAPISPPARSGARGAADRAGLGGVARQAGLGLVSLIFLCGALARIHDTHSTTFFNQLGTLRYPMAVLAIGLGAEILILLVMKSVRRRGFQGCFLWLGPLGWLVLYSSCLSSFLIGSAFPVMIGIIGMGFNCATATAFSLLIDTRVDPSRRETAQSLILSAQGFGTIAGSVIAGVVAWSFERDGAILWDRFWGVAIIFAACTTLLAGHLAAKTPAASRDDTKAG
jgi:Nucleoside H+ symporter